MSVKNTDFLVHLNGKGRRAPFLIVILGVQLFIGLRN